MKKLLLFSLLVFTVGLAGCANLTQRGYQNTQMPYWSDYDFHNQSVNAILNPHQGSAASNHRYQQRVINYKVPRKYNITHQDEQKFQTINSKIQGRMNKIQGQDTGTQGSNNGDQHMAQHPQATGHYGTSGGQ